MSPVFYCSSEGVRREGVAKAAEALRDGKLVVLPTDTLYGVGADAFNSEAVGALLAAKGRGRHMPPPVLVGDVRVLTVWRSTSPTMSAGSSRSSGPGRSPSSSRPSRP